MTSISIAATLLVGKPTNFFKLLVWAFFGNADDGTTGPVDFYPSLPAWVRAVLWWLRNPMHNLTFYVLGCAAEDQTRYGRYPADVFAPGGGFNFAASRTSGHLFYFLLTLAAGSAVRWAVYSLCGAGVPVHVALFVFALVVFVIGLRFIGVLPFVSWQGTRVKAYLGWRERGNFGIKLNISSS